MLFVIVLSALCALVWLFTFIQRVCTKATADIRVKAARKAREASMNNFMTRLFLVAFFELLICGFLNASSISGPGGAFW